MMPITYLVLAVWVPTIIGFFRRYEPYMVAVWGMVLGWCFLPNYDFDVPVLPDINKTNLTGIAVLLACYIFDRDTFRNFRLTKYDIPMLAYIVFAGVTSIVNGLGFYPDAISEMFRSFFLYGIPYLIGRLYFSNVRALRLLLFVLFLAGLIYIPFCLFEVRMSPQLHRMVYGFSVISFAEVVRMGGYRPTVFMQHGLMVSFFLCAAFVCGFGLFRAGLLPKKLFGERLPTSYALLILLATTILCRSTGALMLMVVGVALIFVVLKMKIRILLIITLLVFPVYVYIRCADLFDYQDLIMRINRINEERAQSLEYRFKNEDVLTKKAMEQPLFGWGGWGRSRIYDEDGNDISTTDSMWIISLGARGLLGLSSLTIALILGSILITLKLKKANLSQQDEAVFVTTIVIIAMFMADNTVNYMHNALIVAFSGALLGCCGDWHRAITSEGVFPKEESDFYDFVSDPVATF